MTTRAVVFLPAGETEYAHAARLFAELGDNADDAISAITYLCHPVIVVLYFLLTMKQAKSI